METRNDVEAACPTEPSSGSTPPTLAETDSPADSSARKAKTERSFQCPCESLGDNEQILRLEAISNRHARVRFCALPCVLQCGTLAWGAAFFSF